jgi:hypothetical protein
MKKATLAFVMVLAAALSVWLFLEALQGDWSGVDETVIEHFAEQAGRPARDPLINTDQGDILLSSSWLRVPPAALWPVTSTEGCSLKKMRVLRHELGF